MLTLYLHPLSTPSLSVEMTAHAVGVKFNKKVIDLANREQQSDDYLQINRVGKVPALQDGDFRISESATIMRYLARRENAALYPTEIQAAAYVEQWLDYVIHHVRSPYSRIQFNRMFAPLLGQPVDENSIKTGLHLLEQSLPIIDQRLDESPYLSGDSLSLADIALTASLDPSELIQIDLSPYPRLVSWRERMHQRPFYTAVHSHYGEEVNMG